MLQRGLFQHDETGGATSSSSTSGPPQPRRSPPPAQPLTEPALQQLMSSSELVQQALQMGIDCARLKMAIKRRHAETGAAFGFKSVNQLIDAAFAEQLEQEYRLGVENNASPAAFNRVGTAPVPAEEEEASAPMDVVEQGAGAVVSEGATTTTTEEEEESASSANVREF